MVINLPKKEKAKSLSSDFCSRNSVVAEEIKTIHTRFLSQQELTLLVTPDALLLAGLQKCKRSPRHLFDKGNFSLRTVPTKRKARRCELNRGTTPCDVNMDRYSTRMPLTCGSGKVD
ncbi:hypothetical protein BaRGS_00039607 [Batillaria attramentaria]|uniref:Uncharacterized protein n=1 Tax=Batillaria attramentaria TaxID=370345 RepID=A0ABD0J2L9_9CAEN